MMARKQKPPIQKPSRPPEPVADDFGDGENEDRRRRSEAPTMPPPPPAEGKGATETRTSGMRPKKRVSGPAAAIDEVTADMTRDPRRER
jgi:hypothetical protein